MALLDLKTDLKSLKYGNDLPGGGSSGQPYQQVDINTVDSGFNRFRMTKFDDGLVRGGVVGAANASIVDTLRIGKFLKDFPKGPLFIVKQVGLQLSNPALETKKITIGNGRGILGFVGNILSAINNTLGPTRIYNLGINTLAQVPVNAFGIHFNRHGLLPVQDDQTKYLAVAQFNNEGTGAPNNRLVGLKSQFRLGDRQTDNIPGFNNRRQRRLLAQAINSLVFGGLIKKPKPIGFLDANKELTISRYIGGPGSVYGIGTTTILRKVFTEDKYKIDLALRQSQDLHGKTRDNNGNIQEVKIKDTFDFEISNKTNSSLSSEKFNLSNDKINNSFLNSTASVNDYHGTNKVHQQRGYDDANNRIKTSLGFVGASTKTSSSFIPNKLPDLTDFGSIDDYKRNTLDDSIASQADKNNKSKPVIPQNPVLNFVSASSFSNSSLSDTSFPNLKDNIRSTLINYTASINDTSEINTIGKWEGKLTASNDLGVSKQYFTGSTIDKIPLLRSEITYGGTLSSTIELTRKSNNTSSLIDVNAGAVKNTTYNTYKRIIDSRQLRKSIYTDNGKIVNEFGIYGGDKKLVGSDVTFIEPNSVLPSSLEYPIYTNGSDIVKINIPWNKVSRENRVGSGQQDQINLTPLFENATGTMGDDVTIGGKKYNINDLVKFRIQALNFNNPGLGKWMIFRAYLTQFSDSVDATWNDINYAGRGDKFYIYGGFGRKVNIGFKVAALSAEEMQPMYQKLNYLMGILMGDYAEDGLLRGNLIKMTVGNWFDGQDGILNSLSYTVPQESPWEIGLPTSLGGIEPLVLPHILEVQMTFTPIGSQTKGINKISEKNSETSHFAQNYNKETQYATKFSQVG